MSKTTIKKFEVVSTLGWNHHSINIVSASNEKEARKIVWEQYMSEEQKNHCEEIEVFPLE